MWHVREFSPIIKMTMIHPMALQIYVSLNENVAGISTSGLSFAETDVAQMGLQTLFFNISPNGLWDSS